MGIIDIHCHLLPNLDDGSANMDDTLKALCMAEKQGVEKIIMTPHYYPHSTISKEEVIDLTEQVQDAANAHNIQIVIYPGMECMYSSTLVEDLENGQACTLAESRYVLVEFLEDAPYKYMEFGLAQLKDAGFIPILAHYHRYRCIASLDRLLKLKEEGILLQMNYDAIQREYYYFKRNPFHRHLKMGLVDVMGSDAHGPEHRKYFIEPSIKWMDANLDSKEVLRLTQNLPSRIIQSMLYETI